MLMTPLSINTARRKGPMCGPWVSATGLRGARGRFGACSPAQAVLLLAGLACFAAHAADFLDPEQAFQVSAQQTGPGRLEVLVRIAPGHYLYRAPLKITGEQVTLGPAQVPAGKIKFDENFQKNVETFRGEVRVQVPVLNAGPSYTVQVVSQGCADAGLCYAPMTSRFQIVAPSQSKNTRRP